jgi:general secretion pathway protein M
MMQILQNLSPRERTLVGLLLPIILLVASFQFIWLPLQAKRTSLTLEIAGYRQVIDRVANLGTGPALPVAAAPTTPLSTRVTQSAETAGLILRRLEPEGDMLRVTVDDVAFANVMLWLSDLEVTQSVIVAAIEIDRRTAPGIVSARLLLKANP